VISFGAAPALVIYEWSLRGMGKLGWIAAFVYVAGAALRLARFNTMLEVQDKRWFQACRARRRPRWLPASCSSSTTTASTPRTCAGSRSR